MRVIVEFEPSTSQKPCLGPINIARWCFTEAIDEFPKEWQVEEQHDVAMRNAAWGYGRKEKHRRVVQLIDQESGLVLPCPEMNCFDRRRNGSKLRTVNYSNVGNGFRLVMTEVIA